MPKQKILFPTEFGPLAEKAWENAVYLTKKNDAELILLHALNLPSGLGSIFSSRKEEQIRKEAKNNLAQYIKKLDPKGRLAISTVTRPGVPEKVIVDVAKDLNADLIIFGTKGGSGLRDTLIGSAVNYVIRNTPCPVITIRTKPEYVGFKKIVVPLDLDLESSEQIEWGARLAREFSAELRFFTIFKGGEENREMQESLLRMARDFSISQGLEQVETDFLEHSGKANSEEIRTYADELEADLICIMTQKRSDASLKSSLMGSLSDRIVNYSQRSVISVRSGGKFAALESFIQDK